MEALARLPAAVSCEGGGQMTTAASTVGPFCRKGLSSEARTLGLTSAQRRRVVFQSARVWSQVATSYEVLSGRKDLQDTVLLGKEDLPKMLRKWPQISILCIRELCDVYCYAAACFDGAND